MTASTAVELSVAERAYLIAPAGCGKTYLIAEAVSLSTEGRQLVLTHTHAGVHALRKKLQEMRVPPKQFRVETIAGFSLRYASAYPLLSGLKHLTPTGNDWDHVYDAAHNLLKSRVAHEIVQASYSGIYVDEYQDCTLKHHKVIMALANSLPCRIVGDPLQGIFNIGIDPLVDLGKDIPADFVRLPCPSTPWRWQNSNKNLGAWLIEVRRALISGNQIELTKSPAHYLPCSYENQRKACMNLAKEASVVAIHKWAGQCHKLAKGLRGTYTSMDEMGAKDLLNWAQRIQESEGSDRCVAVIDFAGTCMTKVKTRLSSIRNRCSEGKLPELTRLKRNLAVAELLREVSQTSSLSPVLTTLELIERMEDKVLYRRELWNEMKRSVRIYQSEDFDTLHDAAWHVRNQSRILGRRVEPRTVSRTLLVKGLEFDHAIVLDASTLDKKNLYVAMTRGSESLTILSKNPVLRFTP